MESLYAVPKPRFDNSNVTSDTRMADEATAQEDPVSAPALE